jgi:hypothetical protein
LTLPDALYSEQTYEYIGFTATAASELWNLYLANRDQFPEFNEPGTREYFLSFAFAMIDQVAQPSGSFDDSEWVVAFQSMGLNHATQDVIMLQEFSDIRQTESAVFWAKDIVDLRLGGLEELKRASWERSQQSARQRQRAGREERPDIRSGIPGMRVETAKDAQEHTPGSIVLWKGIAEQRTVGLFTPEHTVKDFKTIISHAPCDFHDGYYWAVDKVIALRYCKWAKQMMTTGSPVLLRLEIENRLVESLQAPILQYPSDIWKHFVHSCRDREWPKELRFLRNQPLIVVHMTKGTTTIANLADWKQIDDRHLLKRRSDNHIAIQYRFSDTDGLDLLQEHCVTSVTMHRVGDEDYGSC